MKTLYLDCSMGAAGDMLTAALLELTDDPYAWVKRFNALSIPGVRMQKTPAVRCGITGTKCTVIVNEQVESDDATAHSHAHEHDHAHAHSTLHGIEHIVRDHLSLPPAVREDVLAVYQLLAQAESHVHGEPVERIHFHEVGAMDALADVTAVCLLMHALSPDEVIASPVCVGSGSVRCAHGILPVPAPATACLLQDVPICSGNIRAELCTPTGAALLKHFVTRFGDMPVMQTRRIGYGMGTRELEQANCVRALLGDTADATDAIVELSCNLDDMTAEDVGFATERLFQAGAVDVYTVPIGMKKNRPGTMLCVLCPPQNKESVLTALFRHTSTLGVRESAQRRYVLRRTTETVHTVFGDVRCKRADGYGVTRKKYEYEDLSRIADAHDLPLCDVRDALEK